MSRRTTKNSSQKRKGAAVAELAICLPAIVLLVFGAIECTSMIFLRQTLAITSYEGIRVAIANSSTIPDVEARCNQILTERNIAGTNIIITPDPGAASRGTPISVQVTAPCGANSILPLQFFNGNTLQGQATMIKE